MSQPEGGRDLVTSAGVTYDRALLPPGFLERGVSEVDQAWWDVRFLSALVERDQPLLQALTQGEADRVGSYVQAMGRELEAMEPGEANRRRRSMLVEADAAERLLRHVESQVGRLRQR